MQIDKQTSKLLHQHQQGVQQQKTSLGLTVLGWHAVASVASGNPATYTRQRGFSGATVHTGAGINDLTMTDALDIAGGDGVIVGGINGTFAVGSSIQFSANTATVIRVTTATLTAVPAAAAADISFWIGILALGPN